MEIHVVSRSGRDRRRLSWRRAWGALLLAALLLPGASRAQSVPAAHITPPHLKYRVDTLPNGLKVISMEDHHAPVVTVEVWYRVGSKDEQAGKAGFAHLFEHLMFKGTAHVPPQGFARYIEGVGGDYNANTYFDRTLFFETVPSNALDRALWLEADRMASLRVDLKNMNSERQVVEEEHRLDVENAPYGMVIEDVLAQLFPARHPYAHSPIGIMSDLDHASLTDVQAFHREYYRPNDATLVVVGDFTTANCLTLIRRYFGPIAAYGKRFDRMPAPAVVQKAATTRTVYDRLAPLPMVVTAYRIPPPASPDTPVFDVMSYILSTGQSSRLYRSIVRDQQLAMQAEGDKFDLKLGGVFFFSAVTNVGKSPRQLEKAIARQVELLREQPVSAAELAKAKNQALTQHVFGLLSTENKASELGEADLLYGTPEEVNRRIAQIDAVTAADVQRVARRYFAPDLCNVLNILPQAMKPKSVGRGTGDEEPAKANSPAVGSRRRASCAGAPSRPAPRAARFHRAIPAQHHPSILTPPPLGPSRPLRLPQIREAKLPNGLRLVVLEDHSQPAVWIRLALPAGSVHDPDGKAGLASMVATMLNKGTPSRTEDQISQTVDGLGATLSASAHDDNITVAASGLSPYTNALLDVIADISLRPAFPQDSLARARTQTLSSIQETLGQPGALADAAIDRLVYGSHPYGNLLSGTASTVKTFTQEDLQRFHAACFTPAGSTLFLVGDVSFERARLRAQRVFGSWTGGAAPVAPRPQMPASGEPAGPPSITLIDRPGAAQTEIRIAAETSGYAAPERIAGSVATAVLGLGQFESRLMREIREKRGLTYGVESFFRRDALAGIFEITTFTKNPSTGEVVKLALEEARRIATEPAPATEMEARKQFLIGTFDVSVATPDGVLTRLIPAVLYGGGPSDLTAYVSRVEAVTSGQVERIMARVESHPFKIVLVGDRSAIESQVRPLGSVTNISADAIDLGSPTLRP
jgi:zinc protease